MSTPKRHHDPHRLVLDGWVYEDPEQMRFAKGCNRHNFGLPEFDDFIDGMEEGIAKDELLDWRQQAFKAFTDNNQHALKGWLQAAYCNWRSRLTIDGALPTLAKGVNQGEGTKVNEEKAEKRRNALLVEYDALRARGKSPEEAMQKANAALDQYETEKIVPYSMKPPKQLMKILKKNRPADWP